MEKLTARMDAMEVLFDTKLAAANDAVKIAASFMDQRLQGMNAFRETLTDQSARMMTRVEALSVLEASTKNIDAQVNVLRDRMEVAARPNYPLFLGVLSVAATLLTGAWIVVGLKMDATVAPLTVEVTALVATQKTMVEVDNTLRNRQQLMGEEQSTQKALLAEVETQFCASDIVRNLMHATDMRTQSILWGKSFPGTIIPTDNAYYPRVCNRSPGNNE